MYNYERTQQLGGSAWVHVPCENFSKLEDCHRYSPFSSNRRLAARQVWCKPGQWQLSLHSGYTEVY